jgi:FKBP-type peptidyl-prolyl cis-trans isomerase|tara:strand:+ start:2516 stop:3070 length:555 start_codon:yes stop_codon:yes gene_type:complete
MGTPRSSYSRGSTPPRDRDRSYSETEDSAEEEEEDLFPMETTFDGDDTNYPEVGDEVTVHYVITLADDPDIIVEDSRRRGPGFPFTFKLGSNRCMPGWDWALARMSQGQRCVFTVPADYAYGEDGHPPLIPSDSALMCDVELVHVGQPKRRDPFSYRMSILPEEEGAEDFDDDDGGAVGASASK